jgi:hypothetical protein
MKEITMRQFSSFNRIPDGFGGASATRQRDVVADAVSTIAILAQASRLPMPAKPVDYSNAYDDGLVHDHSWARTTRN